MSYVAAFSSESVYTSTQYAADIRRKAEERRAKQAVQSTGIDKPDPTFTGSTANKGVESIERRDGEEGSAHHGATGNGSATGKPEKTASISVSWVPTQAATRPRTPEGMAAERTVGAYRRSTFGDTAMMTATGISKPQIAHFV